MLEAPGFSNTSGAVLAVGISALKRMLWEKASRRVRITTRETKTIMPAKEKKKANGGKKLYNIREN
jgi:hypothetical protein